MMMNKESIYFPKTRTRFSSYVQSISWINEIVADSYPGLQKSGSSMSYKDLLFYILVCDEITKTIYKFQNQQFKKKE